MLPSLPYLRRALRHVYWIGGSPCSGKSSIADALAERYGLHVYRCDDAFWAHAMIITAQAQPVFHRLMALSADALWMRPVDQQVTEEIEIYREEFALILADLLALPQTRPILAEGAALMPEIVAPLLQDSHNAIWVVPTADFQRYHYARRAWSREVVQACRDPQQAFQNWMERDIHFARYIQREADARDLPVLLVDGRQSISENTKLVEDHFQLAGASFSGSV